MNTLHVYLSVCLFGNKNLNFDKFDHRSSLIDCSGITFAIFAHFTIDGTLASL